MKILALLLALQDSGERRDPWVGFGPGSWVVLTRRTRDGEKEVETREKHVILAVREGTPVRQILREKDGEFAPTSAETTHAPGVLLAGEEWGAPKMRREELAIDGKKIACTVSEHAVEKGEAKATLAVWRTADLKVPYREIVRDGPDFALTPDIVRVEVSIERGPKKDSHAVRVVALAEKVKVGTREVTCVVEEWTTEEVRAGEPRKGTIKRWLSDEVPGRLVRLEGRLAGGGRTIEMTQAAADFAVKR